MKSASQTSFFYSFPNADRGLNAHITRLHIHAIQQLAVHHLENVREVTRSGSLHYRGVQDIRASVQPIH